MAHRQIGAMRLALAQFSVAPAPDSFAGFVARLQALGQDAKAAGADILVLPEYAAMALAGATVKTPDLAGELEVVVSQAGSLITALRDIAAAEKIFILGGTLPMRDADDKIRNRAPFCSPIGGLAFQDKQTMTRFEAEIWGISPGAAPKVFDTAIGRIGVSICYDSEFPLHVRAQAAAGAQVLLIPSCTDNLAGFNRVRLSARARALENQFFTAVSPLIGAAPWSAAIDENTGYAALYAPPDKVFPPSGIIAKGELNAPTLLIADADLTLVDKTRRDGAVLNHRDWPPTPQAEIIPLP
jgi:predicted amidohydrolase